MIVPGTNIGLAEHTSARVGGPARFYTAPGNVTQLSEAMAWAVARQLPVKVLGRGTNLVISDDGYAGLVIHTAPGLRQVRWGESGLVAAAGAHLPALAAEAVARGLAGLERLAGIPGTAGGAVWMNAGAYERDLAGVVEKVVSLAVGGKRVERNARECEFGYRTSVFQRLDERIVEVVLRLEPAAPRELEAALRGTMERRRRSQPVDMASSGSVFKRTGDIFPGEAIERAGLKGLRAGGVRVSERHANFFVHRGGVTAQDIYDLTHRVRALVTERLGISLEPEIEFLGRFLPWPR